MTRSLIRNIVMALSVVMLLAQAPAAHATSKDVVIDNRGATVHNTFGNCVRTKWDVAQDKCGKNEEVPVSKIMPSKEVSRSFLAFFDWDQSVLRSDAQEIVESAYKAAASNSSNPRFDVTGHADRSGPDAYNMRLSQRRADSVKKALESLGVPSANIATHAMGETMPLVPTADDVREPQNRRVEIIFKK